MGFLELLTIIFAIAKLMDKLDWSWFWVFSPLWIGYSIVIGFVLLIVTLAAILGVPINFTRKDR